MIILTKDFSTEETTERGIFRKKKKIRKNHIEHLQADYDWEFQAALEGVVHYDRQVINNILCEPLHSDNMWRMRQGERTLTYQGRPWLPVKSGIGNGDSNPEWVQCRCGGLVRYKAGTCPACQADITEVHINQKLKKLG